MKYIVTEGQMKAADAYTIEQIGIPSLVLMERAAYAIYQEIKTRVPEARRILIACGSGNNGGDGYALGRMLLADGYLVDLYGVESAHASEDNKKQRDVLQQLGYEVKMLAPLDGKPEKQDGTDNVACCDNGRMDQAESAQIDDIIEDTYDVVIDALFGVGLNRKMEGIYADIIARLNTLCGYKITVDVPSGYSLVEDYGVTCAFQADLTVTFAFYKQKMLHFPYRSVCGEMVVADIGIPEMALVASKQGCQGADAKNEGAEIASPASQQDAWDVPGVSRLLEASDIRRLFPGRVPNSHKGTYGKVGIIAGTGGYGGALLLNATAALRSGVGYVKVLTSLDNRDMLLGQLPEVILRTDLATDEEIEASVAWLSDCDIITLGSGMGMGEQAQKLLQAVLTSLDVDLILDADALNLLAVDASLRQLLLAYANRRREQGGQVILTPHIGEFCRLEKSICEESKKDCEVEKGLDEREPMDAKAEMARGIETCGEAKKGTMQRKISKFSLLPKATDIAKEYNVTIILKDAITQIFYPGGAHYYNLTGNNGMATAGSGDVLAGLLAGLGAGMPPHKRHMLAPLGVYCHGLCGDIAKERMGTYCMTAGELTKAMPEMIMEIMQP